MLIKVFSSSFKNVFRQRMVARFFKTTHCKFASTNSWIRPATDEEIMYDRRQKMGDGIGSYLIRLKSNAIVKPKNVEEALRILKRNIKTMNICLQNKNDQLWLKENENDDIDFEVLYDANIHEEYDKFMHSGYNSETGPLWAFRFISWSQKQINFDYKKDFYPSGNKITSSKNDFHVCHFMMTFHHGIFDGLSAIFIINKLMEVLNNQLEGTETYFENIKPFDANKKVEMCKEIANNFLKNPQLMESKKNEYEKCLVRPDFLNVYPVSCDTNKKIKSETLEGDLGKDTTKKFHHLCKKHGVSVHVGLTSVLNAVITNHLQKRDLNKQSFYKITSTHSVNERPFHEDSTFDLGLCSGKIRFYSETPCNISVKNFWEYAQKYHIHFKERSKCKPSYEEEALKSVSAFNLPATSLEHPSFIFPTLHYYNISNVSDISHFFPEDDKIAVDWITATNPCHWGLFMWISVFSTFRGKLCHSFSYNNHLMEDKDAETIFDNSFHFINDLTTVDEEKTEIN